VGQNSCQLLPVVAGQQPVEDGRRRPYVPATPIDEALCPHNRGRRDKSGDDGE